MKCIVIIPDDGGPVDEDHVLLVDILLKARASVDEVVAAFRSAPRPADVFFQEPGQA